MDEEELSAALNIIHLSPGSVAVSAEDSNTFTVATTKESHRLVLVKWIIFYFTNNKLKALHLCLLFYFEKPSSKKSNLYYTGPRDITPKRGASGRAHLCGSAPGQRRSVAVMLASSFRFGRPVKQTQTSRADAFEFYASGSLTGFNQTQGFGKAVADVRP